uniref:Uncharacterized protein n=1 Tax=Cacopsylla melanoneura TaxID=428564 RepID=A0A8D8PQF9_9HEMI
MKYIQCNNKKEDILHCRFKKKKKIWFKKKKLSKFYFQKSDRLVFLIIFRNRTERGQISDIKTSSLVGGKLLQFLNPKNAPKISYGKNGLLSKLSAEFFCNLLYLVEGDKSILNIF